MDNLGEEYNWEASVSLVKISYFYFFSMYYFANFVHIVFLGQVCDGFLGDCGPEVQFARSRADSWIRAASSL